MYYKKFKNFEEVCKFKKFSPREKAKMIQRLNKAGLSRAAEEDLPLMFDVESNIEKISPTPFITVNDFNVFGYSAAEEIFENFNEFSKIFEFIEKSKLDEVFEILKLKKINPHEAFILSENGYISYKNYHQAWIENSDEFY